MSTRSRALALGAVLLTVGAVGALAAVVTPQIGGGIDFSTDGGIGSNKAAASGGGSQLLLADGSSKLLQADGSSHVCLAGGC